MSDHNRFYEKDQNDITEGSTDHMISEGLSEEVASELALNTREKQPFKSDCDGGKVGCTVHWLREKQILKLGGE